jgi:hypothetical protein
MVSDGLAKDELYLRGPSGTTDTTAFPAVCGFAGSHAAGTPTVGGGKIFLIQGGSSATGAGSSVWVTFEPAFSAVPAVSVTHGEKEEAIFVNAQNAGSIQVLTPSASQDFFWIAIGKK